VAIGGLTVAGCTDPTAARGRPPRVTVVASTDVWGDIAATVGGPRVQVTSLISSPEQDPHTFTASARDELAVSKADVVVENGGGYDDFMGPLIRAAQGHPAVVDAVDVARLTPTAGSPNEHIWYDLAAARKVAGRIAVTLRRADPGHAGYYRSHARAFDASVDRLIRRESVMKERLGHVAVAVTEPVPLFMLAAIGAVDETPPAFSAAVEEGSDVSVSTLDATLRLLTGHRVAALVYNAQTSDVVTDRVKAAAADAGVPVVAVTETLPAHRHYVSWMAQNLDHLDTALSSP
jgi:zinc/manganese transport system substrate-binding protein